MAGEAPERAVSLALEEGGDGEGARAVDAGLTAHVADRFGPAESFAFTLTLRRGDAILGGLRAAGHWRWLYIRQLWVDPAERERGHGRRLIAAALGEARRRSCVGAYIDTFAPEVAEYYARQGFREFGRIPDFPPGHCRIFLQRSLD